MSISNVFPGAVQHPTVYYGYPTVSAPRRVKATILGVIHTTETTGVPMPSSGKSWTFSVERDGTVHQFMDPVIASPWTNGDKQAWDTTNPLVVAAANSAYNFNEFCFITIENVNRIFAGERLTQAQLDADHRILEWGSKLSGLPLDRKHVIGHYQVNGNTRVNCPTVPTDRDRVFGGVIGGSSVPDTATSSPTEIDMHLRPVADLWRFHDHIPYWVDGPDPKYDGTAGSWANTPTGYFAQTKLGFAEVSMAEEWVQKDGVWTSGMWRLIPFPPGTPGKTSAVWAHRADMDPLRPGGATAFAQFVQDAYFGTGYDEVNDKITGSTIGGGFSQADVDAKVKAAIDPLNAKISAKDLYISKYPKG